MRILIKNSAKEFLLATTEAYGKSVPSGPIDGWGANFPIVVDETPILRAPVLVPIALDNVSAHLWFSVLYEAPTLRSTLLAMLYSPAKDLIRTGDLFVTETSESKTTTVKLANAVIKDVKPSVMGVLVRYDYDIVAGEVTYS